MFLKGCRPFSYLKTGAFRHFWGFGASQAAETLKNLCKYPFLVFQRDSFISLIGNFKGKTMGRDVFVAEVGIIPFATPAPASRMT